jgi:uncharacterized protein (TIGR02466 family)
MKDNLIPYSCFSSVIYSIDKPEMVNHVNIICDKYINEAKKNNKNTIEEREKILDKKIEDFGMSHASSSLSNDPNLKELQDFICSTSWDILNDIGYNLKDYVLLLNDLWVQEFSMKGGGHHDGHIHSNRHISGFYFLKCSDKTSFPVFYDPRILKSMIQLPLKDEKDNSFASEKIHVKPRPGLMVFFPSFLEHQFTVDNGIEPFRFIHFNLQAVPKELINNNIKRISS